MSRVFIEEKEWWEVRVPDYRFSEVVMTNSSFYYWNDIMGIPSDYGRYISSSLMHDLSNNLLTGEVRSIKEHAEYFRSKYKGNKYFEYESDHQIIYKYILELVDVIDFSMNDLKTIWKIKSYVDSMFETTVVYMGLHEVSEFNKSISPDILKPFDIPDSFLFKDISVVTDHSMHFPFGRYTFFKILMNIYKEYSSNNEVYKNINEKYEEFANTILIDNLQDCNTYPNSIVEVKKGITKEVDLIVEKNGDIIFIEHKSQFVYDQMGHEDKIVNIFYDSVEKSKKWESLIDKDKKVKIIDRNGKKILIEAKNKSTIFTSLQFFKLENKFQYPIISLDRLVFITKLFTKNFPIIFNEIYRHHYNKSLIKKVTFTDNDFFTSLFEVLSSDSLFIAQYFGSNTLIHIDMWGYDSTWIWLLSLTSIYTNKELMMMNDIVTGKNTLDIYFSEDPLLTLKQSSRVEKGMVEREWDSFFSMVPLKILTICMRIRVVADNNFAENYYLQMKDLMEYLGHDIGEFVKLIET